ncbi:rho guanine nucleotide exchange factor 15 [Denticeps clupeoides]|uniref:Rho guanine nucleotide exchange factor 15 n=1 Tax=Denticeps clupeoides TaxID=299321 RepID=A0AAY4AVW3_9TELE|nr:rho guanine nucleotide exchange factor 15-like [Denticeps clupeoides]
MSSPETLAQAASGTPPRPEPQPRPSAASRVVPESAPQVRAASPEHSGNVKRIVDRFNQPEPALAVTAPVITNGSGAEKANEPPRPKRAPTVRPKPKIPKKGGHPNKDMAPPLPLKRNRIPKKQNCLENRSSGGQEKNDTPKSIHGGRSAPDGKEVEVLLVGGSEAGQVVATPSLPRCEKSCSCVCHLIRPGMRLAWVPIEGDEDEVEERGGEGDTEEEEDGDEGEEEEEEEEELELYQGEEEVEEETRLKGKAKFKFTLDLIGEQFRRRSDPGPPALLTSYTTHNFTSPGNCTKAQSMDEEGGIYDLNIVVNPPPAEETTVSVPLVKPPRLSKLPSVSSNTVGDDPEETPPAVPPRAPILADKSKSPRYTPHGGIPLPQPSPGERHVLRQSSPLGLSSSPPASPRVHRLAPPPPCNLALNGRSGSSQSLDSAGSKMEQKSCSNKDLQTAPCRKKSINWDTMDEPLYQTYRQTVITKEIRRQTVSRNISKTSADYPMDHRRGSAALGAESRASPTPPTGTQSTLWQDLPSVRESRVLESLSSDDIKYQESMFEVVTSEVSYLRSLRVLTEHFLESRELQDTLIPRDRVSLFSNILRIREVSERFLLDLEERLDQSVVITEICDIINYHGQHNFPAYIDYVRNQIYQEKTYTSLMQTNSQFAVVIGRLQESPKCQRLPFVSFLLLPFQRITRIKMLIENILKRTKEKTPEEQMASKALASVSKIIDVCNSEVGKMKQMEELIQTNSMLEFSKVKAVPIITQTRFLEKRGELQEVAKGGTLFHLRPKFSTVFLFLFNDLLLITSKKSADRYVVLDYAHRSLVQLRPLDTDSSGWNLENCLVLSLLENHQSRMFERVMKAATQSEMDRWIAAFPNPNDSDKDAEEVVYEDWDCPQVQCVEQYVAQQADEINLEPAEIVNVIRKTNEGWYEGIKLSDGQKGWFPLANVVEITNEHVRRRNIRERFRVIQAASLVTKNRSTI